MVRLFVIMNISKNSAPIVLGVKKYSPYIQSIYDTNKNTTYISKKDIENLGFSLSSDPKVQIIPMEVPRTFFFN